jgi:hypothetical protein
MVDEWRIGKDWEGSGSGLDEELFRNLFGGTEKNNEKLQSG